MNIAFLVNEINACIPGDATVGLGRAAVNRGHNVYFTAMGDATFNTDGHITVKGVYMNEKYKDNEIFVEKLKSKNAKIEKVSSKEMDVLYLRNNPSDDLDRPWAKFAGVLIGQFAARDGVLVLNDPDTLAYAHVDKMYFEHFPEIVRPASVITRNIEDIEHFFKEQKNKMILKPLEGSGGKDVFLVDQKQKNNLKQIVEAIARNGYVIAQEYLPKAKDGDVRVFMMNGKIMECNNKYAAFRRINKGDDIRSNIHAGGVVDKFKMTDKVLEISEILSPKLIKDGIFCVGLDIVGDKLIEMNITSPGGLNVSSRMYGVDFCDIMIQSIEKKLEYKKHYGNTLTNKELAVME